VRTEHVKYLVMIPHYWGIGDEVNDAVENMLQAGGHINDGYTIWEFPEDTIFQSVHPVFGEITYTHRDSEKDPIQPSVRKIKRDAAFAERRAAILRSLVHDDLDSENREILKYELEELDELLGTE